MKRLLIAAAAALSLAPLAANALTVTYNFNLNSAMEVPTNASTAVGSAQVTVDDTANTISFNLAAFGLGTAVTGLHIHGQALAGANAGVVFNMISNADVTGPVMIGAFAVPNSFAALGTNKAASPGLAAMINAEPFKYYVNLHTTAFGGGEIRGQLAPVPEASTYAMLALGLVGIGAVVRRRRQG